MVATSLVPAAARADPGLDVPLDGYSDKLGWINITLNWNLVADLIRGLKWGATNTSPPFKHLTRSLPMQHSPAFFAFSKLTVQMPVSSMMPTQIFWQVCWLAWHSD